MSEGEGVKSRNPATRTQRRPLIFLRARNWATYRNAPVTGEGGNIITAS